ncbi:hypothetical protein EDD16DRAFT_1657125 [Pisolithus croceorrhizus]|nr:hypothetical protein EDD16DRAFT_1657125 [Pisolithus croceorrhizus]
MFRSLLPMLCICLYAGILCLLDAAGIIYHAMLASPFPSFVVKAGSLFHKTAEPQTKAMKGMANIFNMTSWDTCPHLSLYLS